jgi:organic hydroperoxide reductase OsmC/OhrA
LEPHYYSLSIDWTEDRKGLIHSDELNDSLEVAAPPPFPGGVPRIWSPEHLLTASVLSCFMTTFLAIAEKSRLPFQSFTCAASGKLEQIDGRYLMTEVMLKPVLLIPAESDKEKAGRILHKAEEVCLITNSIRCTVKMEPVIAW